MNSSSTVAPRQQHVFSRVPKSDAVQYSTFDRSHTHKTAFNAGKLIPILVDEVIPGDIKRLYSRSLTRLATPVKPFMDNLYLDTHYFFIPNRLVFNKWKNLQGEQRNPNDSTDFQVPMLNSGATGVDFESVFDYSGVPPKVPYLEFSCLPFRAMNLIWNEYYRDENLQNWRNVGGTGTSQAPVDEFGETDQLSNYSLLPRGKRHDYFTSALPWQQKGDPVIMSLTGDAPVRGNILDDQSKIQYVVPYNTNWHNSSSSDMQIPTANDSGHLGTRLGVPMQKGHDSDQLLNILVGQTLIPNLHADLSNVSGISVADFRTAIQIQAIKELDARTGSRYVEKLKGQWRVTPSNAELQRPEYLGGNSVAFYTNPVANTSGNDTDPQGNLSAFSYAYNQTRGFVKAFEEHGWVIGFISVRADLTYQQGLHRMFSRKKRFDFYEPLLANISEQPIKNKEIYAQGSNVKNAQGTNVDDDTFGYQEAWAEYRYYPNMITGKMRSQYPQSLDVWHLAQEFDGLPKLNSDFIEEKPPIDRVIAIQDEPQFISDNYFSMRDTREMPVYSVPSYLGSRI
ncbi:major capsid protein [Dipodfec virus UOA04_Rod_753]|nr:major capsid protein [Dipodfec virus UOA04_Rod_753]